MVNYVTGFMLSNDGQRVVLIRKRQPSWQQGWLNGVGGKIEPGETPAQAMAREFLEETGVQTDPASWQPFVELDESGLACVYFFFCRNDAAVTAARTMEAEPVEIHAVQPLPDDVLHNLRWLIPMALDPQLVFSQPVRLVERVRAASCPAAAGRA